MGSELSGILAAAYMSIIFFYDTGTHWADVCDHQQAYAVSRHAWKIMWCNIMKVHSRRVSSCGWHSDYSELQHTNKFSISRQFKKDIKVSLYDINGSITVQVYI